ncbi:sel1 repeat family protein [Colwellia sp. RE-S-Sl-9]
MTVFGTNIFEADKLFKQKQYQEARKAYSASVKLGSPHAFYQLGTIYHQGLDVVKDPISSYIWFSLAAEYNFNDAQQVSDKIYQLLSKKSQEQSQKLLTSLKQNLGKSVINQRYFPLLNQELLNEKVTFGGAGKLEVNYQDFELILDSFDTNFESNIADDAGENDPFFIDEDDPFAEEDSNPAFQRPTNTMARKVPFLIVDYDVGPDGSIRNVRKVQEIGYSRTILETFVFSTFPAPNFKENRINFLNRSYIGSAFYSKFRMKEENELLFDRVRRHAKKLKKSNQFNDQYQYAMMLCTFTWLEQEKGEAEQRLKNLAEQGHPFAQYEYGAKLYREQTDIQQGIHWISQASKYGLAKAEYLLATILLHSPWVQQDEKKALFWFESAIKQDHQAAKLQATALKLLAIDSSLHDIPGAIVYLTELEDSQINNPEYYFLLSVSHKNRENRNFREVIRYIEKAIDLGEKYNWDVGYWQGLLEKWTTGSVYIVE